jgi:Ca2+-binding EF-hand superfamily protein
METLNGSALLSGIYSGLTNTYSLIANQYPEGVTLANISAARANPSLNTSLNQTFASYMQSNFSSLDTDKNGIINSSEMNALSNQISTMGLTASQLMQLGTASGISGETLSKVLENFSKIDVNGDGKVTTAEISAYNITSAAEEKKEEYSTRAATTDMSIFYGSEDTSSIDSSSLLDSELTENNINS